MLVLVGGLGQMEDFRARTFINRVVQSVPTVRGVDRHLWPQRITRPRTARRELGICYRSRSDYLLFRTKPAKAALIFLTDLSDGPGVHCVGLALLVFTPSPLRLQDFQALTLEFAFAIHHCPTARCSYSRSRISRHQRRAFAYSR